LQDAVDHLRAYLLTNHSFPDLSTSRTAIRASLLSSALSHFPGTLHVHGRILSDDDYSAALSRLVSFSQLQDDITNTFNSCVIGSPFARVMLKTSVVPSSRQNSLPLAHQLKLHELFKVNYHHIIILSRWHQM
jgi:hypothetical protein